MSEAVKKEYEFVRGNLMLMPYSATAGVLNEEALITLYNKLRSEGLWDIVFHEDTGVNLIKFLNFFSGGQALLQVLAITDNKGSFQPAGMAWVADVCVCGGVLNRATGSFLFFKEFQRPMYTDQFAEMIMEYWYEQLGLDIVVGVTPEPNRPALLYVKRAGFKEVGRIPNYTTLNGKVVTGIITSMTKEEYRQLAGG